jgi:excisionase family DNA binding protein
VNVELTLSPEQVDVIAARVAELLGARDDASPWMTRAEAAAYLRVPVSRLEKRRDIPQHKDGGRVLYHRAELDAFMQSN